VAQAIVTLIPWLVVPIILIALLIFSTIIVRRVRDREARLSARGGFWAGFVIFVIFIISQLRDVREPRFDFSSVPGLDLIPLVSGVLVGFALLWVVRALLPTRLVGVTTLLLTSASTSALYSFMFVESLRVTVLYASLGVALGALVHITLFPSSVRNLWEPVTRGRTTDKPTTPGGPGAGAATESPVPKDQITDTPTNPVP
jgi:hypothetical protein